MSYTYPSGYKGKFLDNKQKTQETYPINWKQHAILIDVHFQLKAD